MPVEDVTVAVLDTVRPRPVWELAHSAGLLLQLLGHAVDERVAGRRASFCGACPRLASVVVAPG